ncbi:hypothetical protein FGO68_gene13729 [Halteria grandinella]|uniref:Uncharacterized protein n=1 Tax=Halteria grandinella TaxID=5974 RepID=A0A8J8NVB1_HALGN|nr:hypothetical protein FGO68_gene13729 [Halteria grandinella]
MSIVYPVIEANGDLVKVQFLRQNDRFDLFDKAIPILLSNTATLQLKFDPLFAPVWNMHQLMIFHEHSQSHLHYIPIFQIIIWVSQFGIDSFKARDNHFGFERQESSKTE